MATVSKDRLSELDGLRGVAIIMVMLYHYFARFANDPEIGRQVYPYGDAFAGFPLARDGYAGVYLFFIVSGFVIFRSLRHSTSLMEFAAKRANRLVLPMVILSTITLILLMIAPSPLFSVGITGLVPSWTFTTPELWRWLDPNVEFIDGVYWTLFVEVRFYIIMAVIWFLLPKEAAAPAFIGIAVLATVIGFFARGGIEQLVGLALFPRFIALFAAGVVYSEIHRSGLQKWHAISLVPLVPLSLLGTAFFGKTGEFDLAVAIWVLVFHALFLALSLRLPAVKIFAFRPLVFIGAISYSLYLLHQRLGLQLISYIPKGMNPFAYIPVVILISALLILAAWISWNYLERLKPFGMRKSPSGEQAPL